VYFGSRADWKPARKTDQRRQTSPASTSAAPPRAAVRRRLPSPVSSAPHRQGHARRAGRHGHDEGLPRGRFACPRQIGRRRAAQGAAAVGRGARACAVRQEGVGGRLQQAGRETTGAADHECRALELRSCARRRLRFRRLTATARRSRPGLGFRDGRLGPRIRLAHSARHLRGPVALPGEDARDSTSPTTSSTASASRRPSTSSAKRPRPSTRRARRCSSSGRASRGTAGGSPPPRRSQGRRRFP
jgi:hypothetical protein